MEKLLLEAQKESSNTSHADSQASSKASSNGDRAANSSPQVDVESLADLKEKDWIWDWSSRPEICPPSDTVVRLKHPAEGSSQRCRLSIRNTWIMRSLLFFMENLPLLIVTHAFSFILGATTMFVCLRRYGSSWVSATVSTTWWTVQTKWCLRVAMDTTCEQIENQRTFVCVLKLCWGTCRVNHDFYTADWIEWRENCWCFYRKQLFLKPLLGSFYRHLFVLLWTKLSVITNIVDIWCANIKKYSFFHQE